MHAQGFSHWLSVSLTNSLYVVAGSAGAVGASMSMSPLRQSPAIESPRLARALPFPFLQRLSLSLIVALPAIAVLAAWRMPLAEEGHQVWPHDVVRNVDALLQPSGASFVRELGLPAIRDERF